MQRIIQINIAGRVLPIEDDAYQLLRDYITSLERQFSGPEGKEIIEDIENRIAELFGMRLQSGAPAIDGNDVKKVIDTLGSAADLHDGNNTTSSSSSYSSAGSSQSYSSSTQGNPRPGYKETGRLLRDPYDKMIGGVCSGVARYFDIDPVILRVIMAVLFFTFGIGLVAYVIAWAIIPQARSYEELNAMNNGKPVSFHDITHNMQEEMHDLKKRGEQMSRELRDFFSRKR
jgi:phage shock protein PspC (stress-responsive transcriptional regulator)